MRKTAQNAGLFFSDGRVAIYPCCSRLNISKTDMGFGKAGQEEQRRAETDVGHPLHGIPIRTTNVGRV
jgi:hypothetical protein